MHLVLSGVGVMLGRQFYTGAEVVALIRMCVRIYQHNYSFYGQGECFAFSISEGAARCSQSQPRFQIKSCNGWPCFSSSKHPDCLNVNLSGSCSTYSATSSPTRPQRLHDCCFFFFCVHVPLSFYIPPFVSKCSAEVFVA